MLAKPNALDIMPKVGNRYKVALAVSKRARQIADKKVREGKIDTIDAVDEASKEIDSGDVYVVDVKSSEEE